MTSPSNSGADVPLQTIEATGSALAMRNFGAYRDDVVRALELVDPEAVASIASLIEQTAGQGGTIYTVGNGGSAATASHIACDLSKTVRNWGGVKIRAMAINDVSTTHSAWANDVSHAMAMANTFELFGPTSADLLIAISASGDSRNILMCLERAASLSVPTVVFTSSDGRANSVADNAIAVSSDDYGVIEDVHSIVGHSLVRSLVGAPVRLSRTQIYKNMDAPDEE